MAEGSWGFPVPTAIMVPDGKGPDVDTFTVRLAAGSGGNPTVDVEADGFTVTAAGTLTLWQGDERGPNYGPQVVTHAFGASAWVSIVRQGTPPPEPEPEPEPKV